jgi:N-acetylmuramoyl-L-alanine amidase
MRWSQSHILLLVIFPVVVYLAIGTAVPIATADTPLINKTIIIDPGHGGVDPGANIVGFNEKDVNLSVALKVRDVLQRYGANVILSREQDVDLDDQCDNDRVKGRHRRDLAARLELVEETGADLYVSIHANADKKPERRGIHTFYNDKSTASKSLADNIHTELQKVVPADKKAYPGDFWVLKANKVPAALVEVGYITNPEERFLLQATDHQQLLAEAISRGICRFISR